MGSLCPLLAGSAASAARQSARKSPARIALKERGRSGTPAAAAESAPAPTESLAAVRMGSSDPALPASSVSSRTFSQKTPKEFAQVTNLNYLCV